MLFITRRQCIKYFICVAEATATHAEGNARPPEGIRAFEGYVDGKVPDDCRVLPSGTLCNLRQAGVEPLRERIEHRRETRDAHRQVDKSDSACV